MTNFITHSTTRCLFLRAGSTVLAIPYWETFASAAGSSKAPPKRVVFLGGGFGFTEDTFYTKQAGRFSEIGLTEGLAPLQRYQDDITMVANITVGATDPHGGSVAYLTGANVEGTPGKRFHNSGIIPALLA